jgi:dCMP deaminase
MRRNAREKDEKRPSLHDRTPKPPGRKEAGIKAYRPGYPALFLGSSAVTKTLTEIGAMEPVAVNDLPKRGTVTDANLGHTVRRLIALGLVRRYRQPAHLDRVLLRKLVIAGLLERWVLESRPSGFHYRLSDIEPLATPVRAILASLGEANGLIVPAQTQPPQKARRIEVAPMDDQRDRHGIHYGPLSILGTPLRTLAIVIVAILGEVDENTIARACAVATDKSVLDLLRPIQRDGIFVTSTVGRFKMCALPDVTWRRPLESLARTIVTLDPNAGALVEAPVRSASGAPGTIVSFLSATCGTEGSRTKTRAGKAQMANKQGGLMEADGISGADRVYGVTRPGWDEYFMEIARTVATRATCPRAMVGAVLTRERRILTTGYNGAPRGVAHCTDAGCMIADGHCLRATHAEANAIVQGALHGVSLQGATAYCTHQPCAGCSKLLISAGVVRIVYRDAYPDAIAEQLLGEAGVALERYQADAVQVLS